VSKISSKAFNILKRVFVVTFVFKRSSFQMESLKVLEKFDGGNFHLWKFKITRCFRNMGFGNWLMGVPPCQVKKLQGLITMRKIQSLLHCFMIISRMPNLHTFNIVTMWKVCGRPFVVCMKLRQLVTSCSFEGDSSASKCKKEMTCLCTSTRWKPLWTNCVPSKWTLRMKMFTWYSSWAFIHPLII